MAEMTERNTMADKPLAEMTEKQQRMLLLHYAMSQGRVSPRNGYFSTRDIDFEKEKRLWEENVEKKKKVMPAATLQLVTPTQQAVEMAKADVEDQEKARKPVTRPIKGAARFFPPGTRDDF